VINNERDKLSAEWYEVLHDREVLGYGSESGRVRVGSSERRTKAEILARTSRRRGQGIVAPREGEVKWQKN